MVEAPMWMIEILEKELDAGNYIFVHYVSKNMITCQLFSVDNGEIAHVNSNIAKKHEKVLHSFDNNYPSGIHLYKIDDCKITDCRRVPYYNPEIGTSEAFQLTIYQQFSMQPKDDGDKQELEANIKAEKIKKSLVYACYSNNMELFNELIANAKPAALHKMLKYTGNPLYFALEHDNFEMFAKLIDAGVDIFKSSLGTNGYISVARMAEPKKYIDYLCTHRKDDVDKICVKDPLTFLSNSTDKELFDYVFEKGNVDVNKVNWYTPVQQFIASRNIFGVKYVLDKGGRVDLKNNGRKLDAMEVAEYELQLNAKTDEDKEMLEDIKLLLKQYTNKR